jgi:hypothetical protein
VISTSGIKTQDLMLRDGSEIQLGKEDRIKARISKVKK